MVFVRAFDRLQNVTKVQFNTMRARQASCVASLDPVAGDSEKKKKSFSDRGAGGRRRSENLSVRLDLVRHV